MKYTVGIDLGGTNIAAGIVDENYTVLRSASIKTRAPRPAREICADMAGLIGELSRACGVRPSCVGIGSPGIVHRGVVRFAGNLRFTDVPLAALMEEMTGLPCTLGNDANAAAMGEAAAGAGRGADSLVMITLGTGVGGGIIEYGRIVDGFNGAGGEIGHMPLIPGGRQCSCGKHGCLEAYCSATALIADTVRAAEADPHSAIHTLCGGKYERITGKTAFDAMRMGDAAGRRVVEEYLYHLSVGTAGIVTLLQPQVLVIGGGIAREGETLLQPVRQYVEQNAYFEKNTPRTRIVSAALGGDAGIIGAAALTRQN